MVMLLWIGLMLWSWFEKMIFYPSRVDVDSFVKVARENEWYSSFCFTYFPSQGVPCPLIGFTTNSFTLMVCGGDPSKCSEKDNIKLLRRRM
jgi:hypothetical protein